MVITERQAAKKKLMAATSMLLVACIMLISATYAWFTLSTAPEITGITTAVGANGNLEIALADTATWADPDGTVSSAVGTSMSSKVATEANITWGNLVDLSDAAYGLSGVTLLPSALNLTASSGNAGYMLSESPLATPSYGADGRVSELVAQTAFAQYQETANQYTMVDDTTQKGVRVIGAASGMSDRQLYYRNAKLNLSSAISQAKISAKASLEDNGEKLANMVIKYALNSNATFGQEDVAVVQNMVTTLSDAQEKMVTAWENAVIAYAASEACATLLDDTTYLAVAAKIQSGDYSVSGTSMTIGSVTVSIPETFATYYTGIQEIKTEINSSKTKVAKLVGQSTVTWSELSNALSNLVDTNSLTVCGIPASDIKKDIDAVVSAYTSAGKLTVEVPSGSGVYADIADYCGDYSAQVTVSEVTYGSISLHNVPAIMTTKSTVSPSYFAKATTVVINAKAPGEGTSSGTISDFYGYALDFYTRTNAANSNLLLQVDEAQRVYSDNVENDLTQGGGSNMEFTVDAENYTAKQMVELMGAIRVVFTDGDGNILAMAKLDLSEYTKEGATLTNTIKANLKLCDYTITTVKDENDKVASVSYKVGDFKSNQIITSLNQNTAKKITAMVYLDGNEVDNAMVANGQTSMTGKMNLQFASDANLVPMEDSGMRNVKTTTSATTTTAE